ncbi:MAG: ABC transporter substrate-binding protein, partial [Candidatus Thermoplasmatota archaeon]|nr:ABC transporter substrate-binding protein [Candidatus Thermoplasmatota archaeon]
SAAPDELQRLIEEGVAGVVGAASSGVTGSILPTAVQNEIVLTTPASTSPALTERENDGFFFRVPPPDSLQGQAMAQLLADDGCEDINILAVNNDYGTGFAETLESAYTAGATNTVFYDEDAASFDTEISQATSGDFSALVFIGYPGQATPMMTSLLNNGRLGDFPIYFSEGVKDPAFINDVGNGPSGNPALAGFQGTTPAGNTNATADFKAEFEEAYDHAPGLFAAESYDAAMYMLLAIHDAGTDDPAVWKSSMQRVANPPGVQTSDVDQALTLLSAGQDIDWIGAASDLTWDERGEVTSGTYAFWSVAEDGTIEEGDPFTVGGSN